MRPSTPRQFIIGKPGDRERPPAILIGDHVGIDFLNSLACPHGPWIEWISNGEDLISWLAAVGAIEPAKVKTLAAAWDDKASDRVAKEARELRESFRAVVEQPAAQKDVPPALITRINGILKRGASYNVIGRDADGSYHLLSRRHWTEPQQLLVPIAAAFADLICNGGWEHVRKCDEPTCPLWFFDRTKGHRRRWCSGSVCGNRIKVAAFRKRHRQGS